MEIWSYAARRNSKIWCELAICGVGCAVAAGCGRSRRDALGRVRGVPRARGFEPWAAFVFFHTCPSLFTRADGLTG